MEPLAVLGTNENAARTFLCKPRLGCEPLGSKDTPPYSCFGIYPIVLSIGYAFSLLRLSDVSEPRWLTPPVQNLW